MKPSTGISIAAINMLAIIAMPNKTFAQQPSTPEEERLTNPRYTIIDLGPVGPPPGQPFMIGNNGLVAGSAIAQDGAEHATLWFHSLKLDLGTPGLGGPNSMAFGVNERGQTVGAAQTSDPETEDFCGFSAYGFPGSNTTCLPFVWREGVMHRLPTLGGPNGFANMIDNRGGIVGLAESAA